MGRTPEPLLFHGVALLFEYGERSLRVLHHEPVEPLMHPPKSFIPGGLRKRTEIRRPKYVYRFE
jgi:hypothetical protein